MTSFPSHDLTSILSPSLLYATLKNRLPWSNKNPLDFSAVAAYLFENEPDSLKDFHRICYPALKYLSTMGVSNVPDLMQLLPAPGAKEFPEQALGFQLLLDQGPRMLFKGIDQRYTNAYFDVISLNYAKQLHALPQALRPDSKARWMDEIGVSFDFWIVARFWFMAPFAHSEGIQDQELQRAMAEESRIAVEGRTGKMDPYRATKDELDKDIYAFSKVFKEFPSHPNIKMDEFVFWFLMLFDAHPPIIKAFGRYPYRNGAVGRESTPRELEWLEDTNHFGEVQEEVAKRIKKDVLAGRWTPLGES
jgi:uncharacterized protein (DUF924 family)